MLSTLVSDTKWAVGQVQPLAGDASARRFHRLTAADGDTAIAMDFAGTNPTAFVTVARYLTSVGLSAPQILSTSTQGLLVEDFGNARFADVMHQDPSQQAQLYDAAVDVLLHLHRATPPSLPQFDPVTMGDAIQPLFQWYVGSDDGFAQISAMLADHIAQIPQRAVLLRDYHTENLMWLPDRDGLRRVGLIDFQDAMIGPAGYDLASLIYDVRRDVAPEHMDRMVQRFAEMTGLNTMPQTVAILGLQRNLRILGVFARLAQRDGKPHYLDFLPRVWRYCQQALEHPSLSDIRELIETHVPPVSDAAISRLRSQCPPLTA